MGGRWTIHLNKFGLMSSAPVVGGQSVPVVPCDDAAVKRVEACIRRNRSLAPDALAYAVLRAAGETP
jgi:hypothetical protein